MRAGQGIALAVGLALVVTGCASPQQVVAEREDALAAAGFVVRPANTPERVAMLQRLPPHRFLTRTQGDSVSYVYSDPLVCHCLYVGSQQAYNTYRRDQLQQRLANDQLLAAQTYQDASWNWGPWGGFGPGFGGGFGFGPGW